MLKSLGAVAPIPAIQTESEKTTTVVNSTVVQHRSAQAIHIVVQSGETLDLYSLITQERVRRRHRTFPLGDRELAMNHLADVKCLALLKKKLLGDGLFIFIFTPCIQPVPTNVPGTGARERE